MASFVEVMAEVEEERDYQDAMWGATKEGGKHSPTEFLVFIQDYTEEGLHKCTRLASPACDEPVQHIMRKIAALAVACMEQHGAPPRDMNDLQTKREKHGIDTGA